MRFSISSITVATTLSVSLLTSGAYSAQEVTPNLASTEPLQTVQLSAAQQTIQNAKMLYTEGNFKGAIKLLTSLDKSAESYAELVINYAQLDLDEAEDLSDDSIDDYPNNARLHYVRGVIMARQAQESIFSALGYAEKSLNSFKKATELAPSNLKYRRALMDFYMGAPSIAGGDKELGKQQLDAIVAQDPFQGVSAQVAYYQMSDNMEKAKETLVRGMTDYPSEINFPFQLGALHAREENYGEAFKYFKQASKIELPELSRDPITNLLNEDYARNANAQLNTLYQLGRTAVVAEINTNEGIAAMGRLQAIAESGKLPENILPNMQWASARLAELYIQAGDKSAAKAELANIKIGDDDDLKKQVKKLRKSLR